MKFTIISWNLFAFTEGKMTAIQSGIQMKSTIVPGTILCVPSVQYRCDEQATVDARIVEICHRVEKMSEKPEASF